MERGNHSPSVPVVGVAPLDLCVKLALMFGLKVMVQAGSAQGKGRPVRPARWVSTCWRRDLGAGAPSLGPLELWGPAGGCCVQSRPAGAWPAAASKSDTQEAVGVEALAVGHRLWK